MPHRSHIAAFYKEWRSADTTLLLHTSGSTGVPKAIRVEKCAMQRSARRTCDYLNIHPGDTTLLCLPTDYIAGKMVVVRALTCGLRLIAVTPSLRPLRYLDTAPHFAAMTPAQVYETLQDEREAALLRAIRVVLIGGGPLDPAVAAALKDHRGAYSTYGMTETVSHIALRHVAQTAYTPLCGVRLALNADGCLVVSDTATGVDQLQTNDLAQILPDGRFRILGRADNTICSGALKWQIEDLEQRLSDLPVPFLITAVRDVRLGQAITLLYEQEAELPTLQTHCRRCLPPLAVPRHYVGVANLPLTATGKPDRAAARRLAEAAIQATGEPQPPSR